MSDKKHIDRLFQEKLKDFEATPSPAVWEQINTELAQGKKDRKVIPIWWRIAGIAAGIILLITIGNSLLNSDESTLPEDSVVETEATEEINTEQNNNDKEPFELQNQNEVASDEVVDPDSGSNEGGVIKSEEELLTTQKSNDSNGNAVANSTNKQPRQELKNNSQLVNQTNRPQNAVAESTQNEKVKNETQNNDHLLDKQKANDLINNEVESNKATVADANDQNDNSESNEAELDNAEEDKLSLTDELEKTEEVAEELVEDKDEMGPRWSVSPNIAPVYFSSFGSGSAIDDEFSNNNKSGEINFSYGVMASYDINDKLSVRGGINQVNMGYSTNDVVVYNNIDPSVNNKPLKNVDLNSNSQNLSFLSANGLNFAEVPSVLSNTIKSSIDQEFGFIEVPIEVEYKLSDKKLGVSVIGGFSTLFLNRNEVYSSLQGDRNLLGEATNINKTSFSANLGLGVDYNVSKRLKLNLEPVLKYQLNTFTDTSGNFNPYFIGVYSGISFKF